ncbi:MAG TPA: hypothetical protein VLG44_07000, partial [Chlamydiales bacterium]|nr:hypothetical protein [Chlamydiales bacterium]
STATNKPQEPKKGCWQTCGKKTVYVLGGAACGFITIAAASALFYSAALYSLPRILDLATSISDLGIMGTLTFGLPDSLVKMSLLGIPIGAILAYRYANRV